MPAELRLRSENFLMRHEMLDESSGLRVVVHQASTPPSPTGGRAILLDIDVSEKRRSWMRLTQYPLRSKRSIT